MSIRPRSLRRRWQSARIRAQVGHWSQKVAGQKRAQRVGVDLDAGRHPFIGQREGSEERRGVTVVGIVIRAEQNDLAFDPSLQLSLIAGSRGAE